MGFKVFDRMDMKERERSAYNRGIRAADKAFSQTMIPAYRTAGHAWAYEAETEYRQKLQKLLKPAPKKRR